MPRKTPFILVDVFTSRPFGGNQLAVFTDAAALNAAEMQELAHEMNFSESTFVMPPESSGARRVRIFTPTVELPMAGHPTGGTTWVLATRGEIALESARVDATLHLGIGPVTVTIESTGGKPEFVWMAHREAEFGAKRDDRKRIAETLGITAAGIRDDLPIQTVSTGKTIHLCPASYARRAREMRPQRGGARGSVQAGRAVASYLCVCRERVGRVLRSFADVRTARRSSRGPSHWKRRSPVRRIRRHLWIDQTRAEGFVPHPARRRDGTAERDSSRGHSQGQRRVRNPDRRAMR